MQNYPLHQLPQRIGKCILLNYKSKLNFLLFFHRISLLSSAKSQAHACYHEVYYSASIFPNQIWCLALHQLQKCYAIRWSCFVLRRCSFFGIISPQVLQYVDCSMCRIVGTLQCHDKQFSHCCINNESNKSVIFVHLFAGEVLHWCLL